MRVIIGTAGILVTLTFFNNYGMKLGGTQYHYDVRLANQLYEKNACRVCGVSSGIHRDCNNIDEEVRANMHIFVAKIYSTIRLHDPNQPAVLLENFTYDGVLEPAIRSTLHPYTIKTLCERIGVKDARDYVTQIGKSAFLNYLKEERNRLVGQSAMDSLSDDARAQITTLKTGIEIIEGKMPYSIWELPED